MKRFLGFFMAAVLLVAAFMILPIHGEAELYDNVIRLHVLAASDKAEDQAVKLKVRDAVLKTTQPLLQDVHTRAEAERILRDAIPAIKCAADATLAAQGSPYVAMVTLGENLARYIYKRLSAAVNDGKAKVSKVRVCESLTSGASYYE